MRGLGLVLAAVAGVLLLAGCAEETPAPDDGSVATLAPAQQSALADVGVEVLSAGTRTVGLDEVQAAFAEADLEPTSALADDDAAADGLALDPGATGGLVGTVSGGTGGQGDRYVVLVFDDPASAVLLATDDPQVLDPESTDRRAQGFVAGNLVAYYARGSGTDRTETVGDALESAAGS